MPVTDQDARALTYLAKRLRDETRGANHWDEAGIYVHVSKMIGQNLALSIERVARHAADVAAKTPGAIGRPFLPAAPERRGDLPPTRVDECRKHAGEWATHCRSCAAEVKGGPGYCEDDDTPTAGGWDAARVREQLRRATTTEETE